MNRLYNILTFTNIGPGASSAQNHLLNVTSAGANVDKIPDFIWGNNEQFSLSANSTQITVTNNGAVAATIEVWACFLHSILREFGASQTTNLSPDPYILIGGGQGGAPSGIEQRFTYTATGAEGSDFFVTLPVARATDTYLVFYALDGVTSIVGIDCPNLAANDRTLTQFRVITTGALTAVDQISFLVANPT